MKSLLVAVAFAAATLTAGCTTVTRQSFIESEVGKFEYEKPLAEVWPYAKQVLQEEGYSYRESDADKVLATEWKEAMAGSQVAASYTRYLVQGYETKDEDGTVHSQVRFTRHSMTSGGMGSSTNIVGGTDPNTGEVSSGTQSYAQSQTAAAATGMTGDRNTGGANTARDLRLEWMLMQKADPENAKLLQKYAEQNYK
jgi:uncharacterized lipoprotein